MKRKEALIEDEKLCLQKLNLNKLEKDWEALDKKIQNGKGMDFILVLGAEDS